MDFKEIIENLKSKTSETVESVKSKFSKSSIEDEEEEFEDDFDEKTGEFDVNSTISEYKVDQEELEDELEDELEEEEFEEELSSEEKRKKIIRYTIIGGAILYIAAEFMFPKDEPKPKVVAKKKRAVKKPKKTKASPKPVVQEGHKEKLKEIEPIPTVTQTSEVKGPSLDTNQNEEITIEPSEKKPEMEQDLTFNEDKLGQNIESQKFQDNMEKIIQKVDETATEQEEAPEFISAPDYTKFGRGLVYNCKDKHWACIDRPRWRECELNLKYNQFYGKDLECFPKSVYKSNRDCRLVQVYNVNMGVSADFCKE
ncbi:MAG: hypothetical protein ACPGJV_06715 [Bacteriovoracaceae bacterium]